MTYIPGIVPADQEKLVCFLQFELDKISEALNVLRTTSIQFGEINVLPSRPQEGTIMNFAATIAGTNAGLYEYINGAWAKL